jgi:hypothetical protein
MFIGTTKPIKEMVNRELQMFKRYWVDAKDIKMLGVVGET